MNKIKYLWLKTLSNIKVLLLFTFLALILFSVSLNLAFSSFTNKYESVTANIKVSGMSYNILIDSVVGNKITVTGNNTKTANIVINALNNRDSKYELVYNVCSDSTCTNYIDNPESLKVEYSSKTIDPVFSTITSNGARQIRIAVTNSSENTYYVQLGINAGYIYNTLSLQNLITTEYNEEDIQIAAIINGELSTTFPLTNDYIATVTCETNKGPSNATGTATWNGTKWVINITGADSGKTICNANFVRPFGNTILANNGGASAIAAKGSPNFTTVAITNEGMYAMADDYGTSYYFRGAVDNNWVKFANKYWRIVRVNGNNTVKLIYSGTTAPTSSTKTVMTGTGTQIGSTAFNTTLNSAEYAGYMYILGQLRGLGTSSAMKTYLENWYVDNLLSYDNKIADTLFCADRSSYTNESGTTPGGGIGATSTYYGGYVRNYSNRSPNIICPHKDDAFTKADTTIGNGKLNHKIGLLTVDEASISGLTRSINSNFYLYTSITYWLFSPAYFWTTGGEARELIITTQGLLSPTNVNYSNAVRPVISLSSNVTATGIGTWNDPYIIN